jgi:DNA polymerase-3 subunit alpha
VQMKPTKLEHVIAMVALFRPGPMEFIPDYISRMHGDSKVELRHPALEPIFHDTFGIPIYQEQIMRAAVELAGYSGSESDDLRSAISKKKAKEIVKHHAKFVKGAVAQGMPSETAEAIFTDWEEFARYGFNKSHAADYGFLAVQTGYLKLHYPTEYMCALLTVSKNETEKVANYINDTRQMGVEVLPPDINKSEWDFVIEDQPDQKPAIRFGMGAIKNVGQASAEIIVQGRVKDGEYKNLNDLARRADLRAVGKRALECLIKVGALEKFGPRAALVEGLDQIVAVSTSHFRAAQAGQMSLFGAHTGVIERIHLPLVPEADRREKLTWERELIGTYMSEHPLAPYLEEIRRVITHSANNLGEAEHEEKTRVAGMVSGIRPYQTKTGKMMGWVTLEDMNGVIELVLFPRVWERFQFALEVGGVIVAEGKVDARSNPSKVLVDNIQTQIKVTEAAQIPLQPQPGATKKAASSREQVAETPATYKQPASRAAKTGGGTSKGQAQEPFEGPPPPEDPPDWEKLHPSTGFAETAKLSPVEAREDDQDTAGEITDPPETQEETAESQMPPKETTPAASTTPSMEAQKTKIEPAVLSVPGRAAKVIPSLHPPEAEENRAPQMVTVLLRSTGDAERDIRRISRLHGTFISFPGKDRFQFQIFEEGKGHLIDFPNDTTHACAGLMQMVKDFVGEENLRVEPITYQ